MTFRGAGRLALPVAQQVDSTASPDPEPEGDVRPLPILAGPRTIERPPPASLPAAVVAATGGFLAGVMTFVLVRALRRPRGAVRRGRRDRRGERIDVASTRSFLIDIHLLQER